MGKHTYKRKKKKITTQKKKIHILLTARGRSKTNNQQLRNNHVISKQTPDDKAKPAGKLGFITQRIKGGNWPLLVKERAITWSPGSLKSE